MLWQEKKAIFTIAARVNMEMHIISFLYSSSIQKTAYCLHSESISQKWIQSVDKLFFLLFSSYRE